MKHPKARLILMESM